MEVSYGLPPCFFLKKDVQGLFNDRSLRRMPVTYIGIPFAVKHFANDFVGEILPDLDMKAGG